LATKRKKGVVGRISRNESKWKVAFAVEGQGKKKIFVYEEKW